MPEAELCDCELPDDGPWVCIIIEDDGAGTDYHTVVGPFDSSESASRFGLTYSLSVVSPLTRVEWFCG